jgi:hypothetical protein
VAVALLRASGPVSDPRIPRIRFTFPPAPPHRQGHP